MICDLCKREYQELEARLACSGCLWTKGCQGSRCPFCYYEAVPQSVLFRKLHSFFKFGKPNMKRANSKKSSEATKPLTDLRLNQGALIDHLDMESHRKLEELIAMGVLPGKEIKVIQKFPSYVFQVGFSQFSIDKDLASCIYVKMSFFEEQIRCKNINSNLKEEEYEIQ